MSDADELFSKLTECFHLLEQFEQKAANLFGGGAAGSAGGGGISIVDSTESIRQSTMTVQQFTRILYRMNHVLSHMGFPKEVDAIHAKFQQLVFMARMVEMSMHFLMWGTGYGAIMGALGMISVGFSAYDWTRGT